MDYTVFDLAKHALMTIGFIVLVLYLVRQAIRSSDKLRLFSVRQRQRKRVDDMLDHMGLSPITEIRLKQLGEIDEYERAELNCVGLGRRIVCAANLYNDKVLILGVRHCDAVMTAIVVALMADKVITDPHDHVQGFVDNKGVFLTREEAWDVAVEAGQIIRRCGGDEGRLYSENLY